MSQVLIQKSISTDITSQAVSVSKLMNEIVQSSLNAKFVSLDRDSDILSFVFSASLTTDENTEFNSIIQNHQPTDAIIKILNDAEVFGRKLVDEYKKLNILRGRTTDEVDQILTDLKDVLDALFTGSLYVALKRINDFTATALVTQADKDDFTTKINKYLGL